MRFAPPLRRAVLLRRWKRFLAAVRFPDGAEATVHCANPGSMLGVSRPGSDVLVRHAAAPGRKLDWSLEAVRVGGAWVGVHPARANDLVEEGLRDGAFPEFGNGPRVRREASPVPGTRFDFHLEPGDGPPWWVEVKYVTLARDGMGLFPDSVSVRAARHAEHLADRVATGERAALVFVCPRSDVAAVGTADGIDPDYGRALRRARAAGVSVLAVRARVDARGLTLADRLAVSPGPHLVGAERLASPVEG